MKNRLKSIDYAVALSIVIISILTGLIQKLTPANIVTAYLEIVGPLVLLIGVGIMYKIAEGCETQMGRHIKIVCIGTLFFLSGWAHRLINRLISLETFGIPTDFTTTFFAALAVGGVILMTYGFYMVKEEAQPNF